MLRFKDISQLRLFRRLLVKKGVAGAAAGAATLDRFAGTITTASLVTAAGAAYTLTLTNAEVSADDLVFASVANGSNSAGVPVLGTIAPATGSVVIEVRNEHATNAFNGTLLISYLVVKSG